MRSVYRNVVGIRMSENRQPQPDFSDLVCATEAARIAHVGYGTVERAIRLGELPVSLQVGTARLVRRDTLLRWAAKRVDGRRLPANVRAEVIDLIAQGKADLFIHRLTGVNRQTVAKIRRTNAA